MKRNIIRINDRVKIITPDVFIRCGYPLTKEDMLRNELKQSDVKRIEDFLSEFGIYPHFFHVVGTDITQYLENKTYTQVFDRVADAIAYGLLAGKRFGGRDRKIFTEYKEYLKDSYGTVVERKVVNTGTYNYGFSGGWEDDYEPATLTNQKTHVLFRVKVDYRHFNGGIQKIEEDVWFEKTNLEKVS